MTNHNLSAPLEQQPQPGQIPVNPEDFVRPDFIRDITVSPGMFYDSMVATGKSSEEADQEIGEALQVAAKEVLAPEAMVAVTRVARSVVERKGAEAVEDTRSRLHQLDELANDPAFRNIAQSRTEMRRAFQMLDTYMTTGQASPQDLELSIRMLRNFSESYAPQRRSIAEKTEIAPRVAAMVGGELEQHEGGIRRTALQMHDEQDQLFTNPGGAKLPEVADAVIERGATSTSEHKQKCVDEMSENGSVVDTVNASLRGAREKAEQLRIPAQQLDEAVNKHLVDPRRLNDTIDYVQTTIYRITQQGMGGPNLLQEPLEMLNRQMLEIDRAVQMGDKSQIKLRESLEETRKSLVNVELALQG